MITATPVGHTFNPVFIDKQPWMRDGTCYGMDEDEADRLFFPEPPRGYSAEAREMCDACPVKADCLAWGMGQEFGMFGGLSPNQRKALLN